MEIGKSSVLRIVPIQPDTGNLARVWIPVRRNSSSAQAEPSNLDSCAVELTVSSASRQGVRCLVQPVMVFQFISFKMTSQGLSRAKSRQKAVWILLLSANILAHRYCTACGLGTSPESPKSQEVLRRSRLLYRWILKWSILFRRVVLHARQASVLPHEDRSAVQDFTSDIFPVRSESDGFRPPASCKADSLLYHTKIGFALACRGHE